MEMLQIIWFFLLGVLLAAFIISGGFDFGVGIIAGTSGSRGFRNRAMSDIAPFWDGNQVWLVTAGGALFAAFPLAYSSILSNLYTPIILFLFLLIFRAVSIEFFMSLDGEKWRSFWSKICALTSGFSMFVFGTALGTLFTGSAVDLSDVQYFGFSKILQPIPLCAGVLLLVFSLVQGNVYLALKNSGDIRQIVRAKIWVSALSICLFVYSACFARYGVSHCFSKAVPLFVLLASYVPLSFAQRLLRRSLVGWAFISTSMFVLICVLAHALAGYPFIVSPTIFSAGIDIFTSSSSEKTLIIMLGVALVGVPLALIYFVCSHIAFRVNKNKI